MNEFSSSLLWTLGRTTLWLTAAAILAFVLLNGLRCRAIAVHRAAWLIVLLTGWLFVQVTVTLPWRARPALAIPFSVPPTTEILEGGTSGDAFPSAAEALPGDAISTTGHTPPARPDDSPRWPVVVVAAWLLGALVTAGLPAVSYLRFVRDLPFGLPLSVEWEREWREAIAESSVKRRIGLCVAEELGPFVCRVWREHRLVVPASLWRELSSRERRAILRHELAHVRRGDLELSLLARLLWLPHWFNPFGWWSLRNFEECGEWACDDAVHRRAPDEAVAFAQVLLRLGEQRRPLYAAAIGGRRLSTRIKRLLNGLYPEDSVMKKAVAFVSLGTLALCGAIQWRVGPRQAQAVEQEVDVPQTQLNVDRTLLQRMADDAAKTYEATKASYDVGTSMMADVYVWSRRWLDAQQNLAKSDADRIDALGAHRERMKNLYLKVNALYTTGTRGGEAEKHFATKYYLAEADVWLAVAKNHGGPPAPVRLVSVEWNGPQGMSLKWDEKGIGEFDSEELVCPATHDFREGQIYRVRLADAPRFGDHVFFGTLEIVVGAVERLPLEISAAELKKIVIANRPMTKVVFRKTNGEIETISDWGKPSSAATAEAERQGEVLAILNVSQGR